MKKRLIGLLSGLGLLALSHTVLADGPCPDGQFNPQNTVCMCPGGSSVAPGASCSGGDGGGVTYLPVPDTWGAIAIDTSIQQKRWGFGNSTKSPQDSKDRALRQCGISTCKVVLSFKNSCGAIAADGKGIWGGGADRNEKKAIQKAADACYNKGAKSCKLWVDPVCAASPK